MRVAVIGGGISGLVAAYRLRGSLGPHAEIMVLDARGRSGGLLHTGMMADGPVELGAEAFVVRRPEALGLVTELGLSEQVVHPSGLRPVIWSQGSTHPLPARTLMGIPSEPQSVRGLVSDQTLARLAAESTREFSWQPGGDMSVYSLVTQRFGREVTERSVDPLLGGVYAGSSRSIGVRAGVPALATALDQGATSLTQAVRAALPPESDTPIFGGLRGGYQVLVDALLTRSAAQFVSARVTELTRFSRGWWVPPAGKVDAVVLATPAPVTAALLTSSVPTVAAVLREIELSSSVVVALALPKDTGLPQNSGVLIATGEPLTAKAFTLSSRKWPHLADREVMWVRASLGRFGDPTTLLRPDAELIAAAVADLSTITGISITPISATVQRWPNALAQYAPGHTDRVAAIEAHLANFDTLAVTGAYLHGVGVPACVASASAAATHIAAAVA